jgi:hypothetical protein
VSRIWRAFGLQPHRSETFKKERWFGELSNKAIRRGSHRSVKELEDAIRAYLDTSNADPKPFVWTNTADHILAKIARFARATLEDHGLDESRDTSETGH